MEQGGDTLYCDEKTFTDVCQIMTTLGRGGFAPVKLAFHMPSLTYVAVKILGNTKRYPTDNNEVDIMKSLVHPHIIKFFQEVQTREFTYVIMEYASKGDLLWQIRKPGGLKECKARKFFRQILQAVKYCHNNCIVHRDIKAKNILIDSNDTAKLCDFGLAVKVLPGEKVNNFCGTLAYCAPEVFWGEPYDGYASDVWNLGVLLYFMVARHVPFQATSSAGLRRQILAANFSVPHHVPIDIFNVIVEILMINPNRRPTINEILERPMVRDSQPQASIPSPTGTPSPRIVGALRGKGCKHEGMIECLGEENYNQAPGGDCCHHQGKSAKSTEPGLVPNLRNLNTFSGALRRATDLTPPTFIVPSEPQKEDKNSRQGGRRHNMPATLCCQPRRIHLAHLSHLRCPVADSLRSSSLASRESPTHSKMALCGSLTASAQPSCSPYPALGTNQNGAANDPEKLWRSHVTSKGSSLGDTVQEVTREVSTRQEEAIIHGQPQDARPASSRNQRHHRWKRVKKTIVSCLRHLCCCLPPTEGNNAFHENQAPQTRDPGDTHRTR